MNAVEIKQERIAYCMDHMTFDRDRFGSFAKVSSATDRNGKAYRVDIDETGDVPVSTHCSCRSTNGCVHRTAVDTYYQQIASVQQEEVEEQQPRRCPGCGHAYSADSDCQPGFCLWNSHYTEGLRNMEDQRLKQTAQQETEPVATPGMPIYRCGGCGCVCGVGKGVDCTPNFCLWNSFYTEGLRRQEDEYNKQLLPGFFNGCKPVQRRQRPHVYNRFSSVA